ncbi:hypothetical protein TI39_contig348g00006 [Zymoseptoria brevis]|uniref:Uncharacterized protein n=1 Tax=Zymoseptoria brevis TaxID=1047168 RepID=A0A0F4GRM8_9PEZI|nr:hypothetical protein TI39_contig348g00006 [Zymoseptoria brevis]
MAGNPFRRSVAANISIPPLDTDTTSTPQPKKKRVQIQSPPALNNEKESGRRLSASDSATRADSPPPPPREDEIFDSSTDDEEAGEARLNTRRNLGSLAPPSAFPGIFDRREGEGAAGGGTTKAPYNPFARTLATQEEESSSRGATNGHDRGNRDTASRPAAIDVDAFKNILLTGSATPSAANRPQDFNDSTETSMFDSNYSLRGPLSPDMDGYDDYASASPDEADDPDDDDDDHDFTSERKNLMGQGRSDDLAPPAPPKSLKPTRGPQTVSFADFDQSIPPGWQAPSRNPSPLPRAGILRPSTQKASSDMNKPLPPPPSAGMKSVGEESALPPIVPDKDVPVSPPPQPEFQPQADAEPSPAPMRSQPQPLLQRQQSDDASTPKKAAPPPPVSRRKQASSTPTDRPRSSSNVSTTSSNFTPPASESAISSLPSSPLTGPTKPQYSTTKPAAPTIPPPPPSRKPHPTSSTESKPQLDIPATENIPPPKLVPPPPPRRRPSKTSQTSRTSSPAHSLRTSIPPQSNSTPGAPPPPPPRRAMGTTGINPGSARSSLDGVRRQGSASGSVARSSFESGRRGTGSEDATTPMQGKAVEERDVLADMRAFEEEIEALRRAGSG